MTQHSPELILRSGGRQNKKMKQMKIGVYYNRLHYQFYLYLKNSRGHFFNFKVSQSRCYGVVGVVAKKSPPTCQYHPSWWLETTSTVHLTACLWLADPYANYVIIVRIFSIHRSAFWQASKMWWLLAMDVLTTLSFIWIC